MTIDEAIAHALEMAERNETQIDKIGRQFIGCAMDKYATDCRECAAEHRQLAEWLTELRELRNSLGAVKLKDMKEAVGILQELNTENNQLTSQLAEAKRLLKVAVEDFAMYGALKDLSAEQRVQNPDWRRFNRVFDALSHQWRYADEALTIIGEEGGTNGRV